MTHHAEYWPERRLPKNLKRDLATGIPHASDRQVLEQKLQYVSKHQRFSPMVDCVEQFQSYNWKDADLLWMVSDLFKHVSLDLVEVESFSEILDKNPIELKGGYIATVNKFPKVIKVEREEFPEGTSFTPVLDSGDVSFENTMEHEFRRIRSFFQPANYLFTAVSENPNQQLGQLLLSGELHNSSQGEVAQLQEAIYIEDATTFVNKGMAFRAMMDIDGAEFDPFAAFSFQALKRADAFAKTCLDAC